MLFSSLAANAQIKFGAKGGLNYPTLKITADSRLSELTTTRGSGFHAGIFLRAQAVSVFFQPELLYTKTATNFEFYQDSTKFTNTFILHRLDVPLPVGVKFGKLLFFGGPVASFILKNPSEIFENNYKVATWGYQLGAGLKLEDLLVELKYEGPFSDLNLEAKINNENFLVDARQNMWIVSVGLLF